MSIQTGLLFPIDVKSTPPKESYRNVFNIQKGVNHLSFIDIERHNELADLELPTPKQNFTDEMLRNEAYNMFLEAIKTEYQYKLPSLSREEFNNVVEEELNSLIALQHQIDALRFEMFTRTEAIFPMFQSKLVDLNFIPNRKENAKKMIIFRKLWKHYKSRMISSLGSKYKQWIELDHYRIDVDGEAQIMEAYEYNHYAYKVILTRLRGNVTGHNIKGTDVVFITQMDIQWQPLIKDFWGSFPDINFDRVNSMSAAECRETSWGVRLRKEYATEQSAKKLLDDLKEGMLKFEGSVKTQSGKIVSSEEGPMFRYMKRTYFVRPEDENCHGEGRNLHGLKQSYCREIAKGTVYNKINYGSHNNLPASSLFTQLGYRMPSVY